MSFAPARKSQVPLVGGIADIAGDYGFYVLDIWGVLHDGVRPFAGTLECLKNLRVQGAGIVLLSNTPDRSATVATSLAAMGIVPALYDHLLTAGEAAWHTLKDAQDFGRRCFCPGSDFRRDASGKPLFFAGLDLEFVGNPEDASFFLNACGGFTDQEIAQQMEQTKAALACGLPMVCVNPDLVVNVGERLFTCAGTFAKFYEEQGGQVSYFGKPHLPIYEQAWQRLDRPDKKNMLAVGDSLRTDIQGANGFGIDSVLNLTGIHWDSLHENGAPDAGKIDSLLAGQPHRPDYVMAGFRWV